MVYMKMSRGKKIAFWILGILLVTVISAVSVGYYYVHSLADKVETVDIDKEDIVVAPEVEEKVSKYNDTILNIALFGVDADDKGSGRSDSIMIATVDTKHKKLKLTSIMRDSYVNIDGHGVDKINHAYAFGGPTLAMSTINQNFDLNIRDFATVNFESLPKIIDKIGGIELDIDSEELKYINGYIKDINRINHTSSPEIQATGLQHVDGTQAMAYCRIRYTTGGDYKRTERHREVLSTMFSKITTMSVTSYPSLLNEILPMIRTSLKSFDILDIGNEVLKMGISNIEQERFPLDNYSQGKMINSIYYLTFDKDATAKQIHEYIFEDKKSW